MTNKLIAIVNSLKVPKIKKILLYEIKFLVPNYSCLQNSWLGGYCPQIPVLSVLCPQLNLLNTPPPTKFPGTPLSSNGRNRNQSIVTCSSSVQIWWQETMRIITCLVLQVYVTSTVRRCLPFRMFVPRHLSAAQIFTEKNRDSYRPTTTTAIEIRRFLKKKK